MLTALQKGMKLFKKNCNSCHTAPLFNSNIYASNGLSIDTNYNDVGEGEWVAFIFADGNLMIAKARENGCAALICNVGDDLYLIP